MNQLDEFAKAALTGILAAEGQIPGTEGYPAENVAEIAYKIAEAMMKERESRL